MAITKISGAQRTLGSSVLSADVFSPELKQMYLSQKVTHKPEFERNLDKIEANIKPEVGGLIQIAQRKKKVKEEKAYEKQINSRFNADDTSKMGGITMNGMTVGEVTTDGSNSINEKA